MFNTMRSRREKQAKTRIDGGVRDRQDERVLTGSDGQPLARDLWVISQPFVFRRLS